MALWVAVHGYENEEQIIDRVMNRPIHELVERTNYLYQNLLDILGLGVFESVRITDAVLGSEEGSEPDVGDVVYLNPMTREYIRALSSTSVLDVFVAGASTYAIGLLVSKSGGVGTVVLLGRIKLDTNGSSWDLSDMLEEGESFRNGPYFLSATNAGKLTAYPSGPAIYMGYFMAQADNTDEGDFAFISPQYKDTAEAHVHRSYPLTSQPAGMQLDLGVNPLPNIEHEVQGFMADTDPTQNERVPRIIAYGDWTGTLDTQYTLKLTNGDGSTKPTDFSDAYIEWSSDDPDEEDDKARIPSFYSQISVGTKGLKIVLEPKDASNWDVVYDDDGVDALGKRTWSITVPTMTQGWLQNIYYQYMGANIVGTDQGFSFILFDGPHASDGREHDEIFIKCAKISYIDYVGTPLDGETITIDGTTFEFDDDGSVTGNNILVPLGADADSSYVNLVDVILGSAISNLTPVLDITGSQFLCGMQASGTMSSTGTIPTPTNMASGAGVLTKGAGTADFLIYDKYNRSLLTSTAYWTNAEYWTPKTLTNDLSIMAIPYNIDGNAALSDNVGNGDYWNTEIIDEAPGAYFKYSMGMHTSLNQFYPPVPVHAALLVLNGVELDSYEHFPSDPSYRICRSTVYWYTNTYGSVPWPRDWESATIPYATEYTQNMILHFVQMSLESGVVTSLRPAPGSPITITQCGTNDLATTGDLQLNLDLALRADPGTLGGYQVFKDIYGQQLRKGPVVEKIVPGTGIDIVSLGGHPEGQGIVTISLSEGQAYLGDFEEVALENAKQDIIGMFPYIRLPDWTTGETNRSSGFVAKFRVPHRLQAGSEYRVIVYLTVFGHVDIPANVEAYKYAGIDFSYSILPDYTLTKLNAPPSPPPHDGTTEHAWSTLVDGLIEGGPTNAQIPFGKPDVASEPIYSAYDPMLIHNDPDIVNEDRRTHKVLGNPFPESGTLVKPGSLVGIRVSRADVTVLPEFEYTSSVGFINLRWRLVEVTT